MKFVGQGFQKLQQEQDHTDMFFAPATLILIQWPWHMKLT